MWPLHASLNALSAAANLALAAACSLPAPLFRAAFKSYRQRTLLGAPFGQFTAVVGPNGCGKSVVVSAEAVGACMQWPCLNGAALAASLCPQAVEL